MSGQLSRVAIVTGAASGIGRAVAERFVTDGGSVVAVDRSSTELEALEASQPRTVVLSGDVTDAAVNEAAVALAVERFGRLDASVLNAGIPMSGDVLTLPIEQLQRALDVNVVAVVLGIRAAVPEMRRLGGGAIAVTASTSGLGGDPGMWPYNTSKGAVVNLVRAMAVELGADAIRVNAVCPGPTHTGMTTRLQALPEAHEGLRSRIPLQRWAEAAEVAAVINFLVSPDASFVTGAVVPVDGGVTASTGQFLPRQVSP